MIRVQNLSKAYGPTTAVDKISFNISKGEVVGFLGPNGAGKTTTMRMLTGFIGADGGSIKIGGKSLWDDVEAAKNQIGYLPENNPLYADMMVLEYLRFIGRMRGMSSEKLDEQIPKYLKLYGLTEVVSKDIGELSKGFRQRVGLALASLGDPPIMILDEPTNGLDPNQIIEIRNLIKEIGKTKTVILSTHNLSEAEATCSRILIINKGSIVADDATEALSKKSLGVVIKARIKCDGDLKSKLNTVSGIKEIRNIKRDNDWNAVTLAMDTGSGDEAGQIVFDAAVAGGWKLGELRVQTASLEDVFTKLTQDQ
jgi:gliding motility-associated transport system ATP-binding protein